MPRQFAKLFGPPEDQILVTWEPDDEGSPAICIAFDPGVPALAIAKVWASFTDPEGRDRGYKEFLDLPEEVVRGSVTKLRATMQETFRDNPQSGPNDKENVRVPVDL